MCSLPIGEPASPEPSVGDSSYRLTFVELERAVRTTDPAAFFVLPRILRRVIKQDRRLGGFGLRVPHRTSYVIGCEPLLQAVAKAELGLTEDAVLPERVVLLARPDPQDLAETPAGDILIRCWRLLFHARIHLALEERAAGDGLSAAIVRRRIHQLGSARFDEIRTVLGQEDWLLPPHSDESIYAEFVAVYLELRHFSSTFLARYFPGFACLAHHDGRAPTAEKSRLADLEAVDRLIGQDVDAPSLFRATRPPGAPDPQDRYELTDLASLPIEPEAPASEPELPVEHPSETKYRRLMRKSQRPAALGNVVRAAIYRARAERFAPPEFAARVRSAIKLDIYRLIRRLQAALELDAASPQPWQESLFALLNQTPRGIWTAEARLLYDLQKVCVDHEREIYTIDLVEWALSWGRRPIKRQLPNQRDVLMLKHLRSASRRLAVVRLSDAQRRQLALLVHEAQRRVEARLREQIGPHIAAALDAVGLVPQNLPERVARKKMIAELLDQIGQRDFLTMGDLRDAISRNNLKLPDLSEPRDFLRGDQLLRADRKLALALDGVYRRGEFYLRWMQRLSSLGFGTRIGRFLTRFVVVPFGGAYVVLVFASHVWEWITGVHPPLGDTEALDMAEFGVELTTGEFHLTSPTVVFALGLLLCLLNSAAFRRGIVLLLKTSYQLLRAVLVEPIRWVVQSPLLQQILHSRPFALTLRFLLKPSLWTGVIWLLLPGSVTNRQPSSGTVVAIFLFVNLLLNSRLGRNVEEVIIDGIVQAWQRFGLRLIAGIFWMLVDVFKWILETVERLMYAVDEWLRFRRGDRRVSVVAKAGLGLLWFFVAYVLRFAVNVLIEPQINPIKHFPVVTVGHKLLLGAYHPFARLLESTMEPAMAWTVSFAIIWCIPGIFGFLVWELKENWRSYAANRRPNLFPARIGPTGETMARFLKPGFHSGTLPKRYAKLRDAERQARAGGSWYPVRKHVQVLYRIQMSIGRWIEREFLELFAQSNSWQAPPVTLRAVRLGTNCVRLALGCPGLAETDLHIALEAESGWLVAGITDPGWIDRLQPCQRQVLVTALIGLYKSAGVDLVRQQIEVQFGSPLPWYAFSPSGLVLWPQGEEDVEVLYDLQTDRPIAPQTVRGQTRRLLPTLLRQQLLFSEVPAAWDDWVMIWNQDIAGQGHPRGSIAPVRVLP
jgi:hypothetical protein